MRAEVLPALWRLHLPRLTHEASMTAPTPTTLESVRSPLPREANMPAVAPGFGSLQSFELMQRAANLLASSTLVPAAYRKTIEKTDRYGNVTESRENPNALANAVVALNMAQRMGADPLMVMQNLYIVEGRPSWSSQWIIAAINGCGRFSPLRFEITPLGRKKVPYTSFEWKDGPNGRRVREERRQDVDIDDLVCIAWALERGSDTRLESPPVSIELAVKEGWYTKNGSKWQTMPEVMLRYRTASFFGKLYAPELLMGLTTVEEAADIVDINPDGSYSVNRTTLDEMRAGRAQPADEVPRTAAAEPAASTGDEPAAADAQPSHDDDTGQGGPEDGHLQDGFQFNESGLVQGIREDIASATTPEDLDLARSAISGVSDEATKAELNAAASARMRAIAAAADEQPQRQQQQRAGAPRRPRAPIGAE
ncbi:recombinase RecT [Burkholderia ubonensis]|nr:recombinase RecT [Burkholderia ubonensis]